MVKGEAQCHCRLLCARGGHAGGHDLLQGESTSTHEPLHRLLADI